MNATDVTVDTFRIRRVRSIDDLRTCFSVLGAVFTPAITPNDSRFERLFRDFEQSRPVMVVAEQDEQVVGGVLGRLGDGVVGANIVALEDHVRGVGLGRRLMQTMEVEAMALGAASIVLGAIAQARGFYASLGYSGKHVGMSKGLSLPGRVRDLRVRKLLSLLGDMDEGHMVTTDPETGKIPPLW